MDRCGVTVAQETEYTAARKVVRDKVQAALRRGVRDHMEALLGLHPGGGTTMGDLERLVKHLTVHIMEVL